MNNDIVLTYISIIIAIYALSPNQMKVKVSLASWFFKGLFIFTIGILFFGSFDTVLAYFGDIVSYFENLFSFNWNQDIYRLIVWLLQAFSLWGMFLTGKLRRGNMNLFRFHMNRLFVGKKREQLFELLKPNLKKAFRIGFHKNYFQELKSKYCSQSFTYVARIVDDLSSEDKDDKKNKENKSIYFKLKQSVFSFFTKVKQKLIDIFVCGNNWLIPPSNFILEDIFSNQFIDELVKNNEALGYDIMEEYLENASGRGKEFYKQFITGLLININSTTSYQFSELDWEKGTVDNDYIKILIENFSELNLIKNMDIAVREMLYDPKNYKKLNYEYSPGSDYNSGGEVVLHIWRLFRIIVFVDKEELFLSNTPMYLAKDLMKVTDWSKYEEGTYEFNTGTYYLLYELFDILENVCSVNSDHLSRYFWTLGRVLDFSIDGQEVPFEFKESIAHLSLYFLADEPFIEEKNKGLKSLLKHYPSIRQYFQGDIHDEFEIHKKTNKELLDILDE